VCVVWSVCSPRADATLPLIIPDTDTDTDTHTQDRDKDRDRDRDRDTAVPNLLLM
jgi:hypothetical protein